MLLIDPGTGAIVGANEAAANFYGYSEPQLLSMNISDINTLSPEETAAEMRAAEAAQRNYFLFQHRLAGGEVRSVEVYSYPVEYEAQRVLFSVIHESPTDVLERTPGG
jgi:PAS domain S-box-containing protein